MDLCQRCERLYEALDRTRQEKGLRVSEGTLASEIEQRLDDEEDRARYAITDHRWSGYHPHGYQYR